jgi:hypothetical protein
MSSNKMAVGTRTFPPVTTTTMVLDLDTVFKKKRCSERVVAESCKSIKFSY